MRKLLFLLLCCTLFIISACASSESTSTGSSDTGNTTYTISINGSDNVYTSSQNNYTITTSPEGVSVTGVVWSIDNATLATIDESTGVLTTNNIAGQITITATADDKTANKIVNIVKQLEISGNNITGINGVITLKVLNNTSNNLTWSSDNQAVATVNNGVITGVSAGTANITVSEGGNISNTFAVTIKDVPNGYELIDGAYHVYNLAGFKAWREAVLIDKSLSCYLHSDLDFSSEADNPMIEGVYTGTFEGNGHIIKNYTITNGQGIFYNVGSAGKILNVTFDNANVTYTRDLFTSSAGLIITNLNGLVENVHVQNSQLTVNTNNRYNDIGIITARAFVSEIKNCTVTNSTLTVNGKMDYTGGIIGQSLDDSKVIGCFVENLTITTQGSLYKIAGIGGIVGQHPGSPTNSTIIGCGVANTTIKNTLYNSVIGGNIGGLVGVGGGNIHASYFYGTVDNVDSTAAGLDFYSFSGTASALYVKKQGGTIDTIKNQNSTTRVDDTSVTWEQAVESMNQYLVDNGYTDFAYKYDANKGYPVIEYSK